MRNKHLFRIFTYLVSIGISSTLFQAQAETKQTSIVYNFANKSLWTRDVDPDLPAMGPEHYLFGGATNIDLNIVPMDEDLLKQLSTRGVSQFVADTLQGKNKINKKFGVGETKLVDYKLTEAKDLRILQIRSRQTIGIDKIQTVEKYYFYKNTTLHLELRWQDDSDQRKVKQALKEFSQMVVRAPAGIGP